jgi:hypothetical protein
VSCGRRTKAIIPRDAHDQPQQVFLQDERIRRLIDDPVEPRRETIGDTLTEGEPVRITGISNFAPEIPQRVDNNSDRLCFENASPRS